MGLLKWTFHVSIFQQQITKVTIAYITKSIPTFFKNCYYCYLLLLRFIQQFNFIYSIFTLSTIYSHNLSLSTLTNTVMTTRLESGR